MGETASATSDVEIFGGEGETVRCAGDDDGEDVLADAVDGWSVGGSGEIVGFCHGMG